MPESHDLTFVAVTMRRKE